MANYVNNRLLLDELVKFQTKLKEAEANGKPLPVANDIIGNAIVGIAKNYSNKHKFHSYSNLWKEEMISDGIENCIKYGLMGFDPNKSSNPFAYFTEIIHWSFVRRIKREKKEQYKKLKGHQENDLIHKLNSNLYKSNFENEVADNLIRDFERKMEEEKDKRNSKKGVEQFLEPDDEKVENNS